MTDPSIPRTDYYVYALFREDGETPFYIGKGRGKRMDRHEKELDGLNPHKDNIIRKVVTALGHLPKAKLVVGLTNEMAIRIEKDIIRLIGRRSLANLTDGGEGLNPSPEGIERRRAAMVRQWAEPEIRAKRMKVVRFTPEWRSSAEGQEYERNRRAAIKEFWADPERSRQRREHASKVLAISRENNPHRPLSDKGRANIVAGLKDPTNIAKRAGAQRVAFSTPEAKAKRSEVSKKMWEDRREWRKTPEAKARRSAASKLAWGRRRAQKTAPLAKASPKSAP